MHSLKADKIQLIIIYYLIHLLCNVLTLIYHYKLQNLHAMNRKHYYSKELGTLHLNDKQIPFYNFQFNLLRLLQFSNTIFLLYIFIKYLHLHNNHNHKAQAYKIMLSKFYLMDSFFMRLILTHHSNSHFNSFYKHLFMINHYMFYKVTPSILTIFINNNIRHLIYVKHSKINIFLYFNLLKLMRPFTFFLVDKFFINQRL